MILWAYQYFLYSSRYKMEFYILTVAFVTIFCPFSLFTLHLNSLLISIVTALSSDVEVVQGVPKQKKKHNKKIYRLVL